MKRTRNRRPVDKVYGSEAFDKPASADRDLVSIYAETIVGMCASNFHVRNVGLHKLCNGNGPIRFLTMGFVA
jgi:hypothetical protein